MRANINGINLGYDDLGNGPAVILVHGFPLCREMWRPQLESLVANGFRVIAPDLRGFGESEPGPERFSISTCGDDIIELMNYLGIGRAVMVGLAMSGEVLHDMLERYPRRVAATCYLAPGGNLSDQHDQKLAEQVRAGHLQAAIDGLCQQYLPGPQNLDRQELALKIRSWMESAAPNSLTTALAIQLRRATRPESLGGVRHVIRGKSPLLNLEFPHEFNSSLLGFLHGLGPNRTRPVNMAQVA